VLEFGSQEALEIVFDDEDAEEIGVAAGAEDVPGERGHEEGGQCGGMKKAKGVAPALGEKRPEENGAPHEDDSCWAFRQNREPEEKAEENQC